MILFLAVSFLASIIGAVCGIGGGVIIKPVLDMLQLADSVETINFLSGCTVLAMSSYSVAKAFMTKDKRVKMETGTPLAIGAAVGGVLGKQLFSAIKSMFESPNAVGCVQAVCLGLVTLGTLIYTVMKSHIRTRAMKGALPCVATGLCLGVMSSFLGIGGGPINLVVLFYFFSMDTKTAAANSLYIILFSQTASLIVTLIKGVPDFEWPALISMVVGGIGGGIVGRKLNTRMDNKAVDRLFICLMAAIIGICVYNAGHYAGIL